MAESNPFQVLGLPERFEIDQAELQRRFIAASAANHPDRFTDPLEQADAASRAAEINQAHQILRDPEKRANALLAFLGGAAKEDDKSLPPDLLMEMMETRERMEEAQAANDQTTIHELRTWARQERQAHLTRIGDLFKQVQVSNQTEQAPLLRQVRLELNALRYFQRMIEQA